MNVASHLIADRVFMEIAEKFRNLNLPIIVLSDSLIPKELGDYFHKAFKPAYILDSTDPFTAHIAMRNSAILICSNSQFSLISAALNPSALCIIPKQWFDANGKHIEVPIHSRSSFEVLS